MSKQELEAEIAEINRKIDELNKPFNGLNRQYCHDQCVRLMKRRRGLEVELWEIEKEQEDQ